MFLSLVNFLSFYFISVGKMDMLQSTITANSAQRKSPLSPTALFSVKCKLAFRFMVIPQIHCKQEIT